MELMVDLETFGVSPNAPIVQIGAVTFDLLNFSLEPKKFIANISLQSSILFGGGVIDKSTEKWWKTAPLEAQEDICHGPMEHIRDALLRFKGFIETHDIDTIWANGAGDDIPWLRSAYIACDIEIPFRHNHVRDTRTLWKLAEELGWERPIRRPTAHIAIEDSLAQVLDTQSSYEYIRAAVTAGLSVKPEE